MRGDGRPRAEEVALDTVEGFETAVLEADVFQEGVGSPGGSVENGGEVGGGSHRPKGFEVFLLIQVLSLIDFEKGRGGGGAPLKPVAPKPALPPLGDLYGWNEAKTLSELVIQDSRKTA